MSYPDFFGIPNSRFENQGYLVSYDDNTDKGLQGRTLREKKFIYFALAGAGDLKDKGLMRKQTLTDKSLVERHDTFSAIVHYSQPVYDFLSQDKEVKFEWDNKLYEITDYSDYRGHKTYITIELSKRVFRTG